MEKVSVIVPVYNGEEYLRRCLDSIVKQTYKELEIILVNDGSKDNSLKIMEEYAKKDKRIIIIDKKNEGVSVARNTGIKKATGKYVTFVDCDDYLDLDMINKLYKAIIKENVQIVRCNYKVHYRDNVKIDYGDLSRYANKLLDKDDISDDIIKDILDGVFPCFVVLLMVDRELLLETDLFPKGIAMMEDVVLYVDLLTRVENIYVLDKAMYNIEFNEESSTNNYKNYKRNILDVIKVNDKVEAILTKNKMFLIDNMMRLNTRHCAIIADFIFKTYLAGGDAKKLCYELAENKGIKKIVSRCSFSSIDEQRGYIIRAIKTKQLFFINWYFWARKIYRKYRRK